MTTENYVSFKIAKLLKEKGFDADTHYYYSKDGDLFFSAFSINNAKAGINNVIAPTLQMAMKWLREVHGIHISITPLSFEDGIFWMYKTIKLWSDNNCSELHRSDSRVGFNTYEEACEAGIKYCLENLI